MGMSWHDALFPVVCVAWCLRGFRSCMQPSGGQAGTDASQVFVAQFVFWRLAYNVGLGLLLHFQVCQMCDIHLPCPKPPGVSASPIPAVPPVILHTVLRDAGQEELVSVLPAKVCYSGR